VGACRELDQVIREIIRRIKELDFGAILDDIGALKMPFLDPYWPEINRSPMRLLRRPARQTPENKGFLPGGLRATDPIYRL